LLGESLGINNVAGFDWGGRPPFPGVIPQGASGAREQSTASLVLAGAALLPTGVLGIQEPDDLDDVTLPEAQVAQDSSIDIRQHALVHRLPRKGLGVPLTQTRLDVAAQEELEPVVFGLLRLDGGADLGSRGLVPAATPAGRCGPLLEIRERLVLVQRDASHALDILEIVERHLGDGDGNPDAVQLVQVELAIFDAEELGFDRERLGSVCPRADLGRVGF
jgi:hypothetical protein